MGFSPNMNKTLKLSIFLLIAILGIFVTPQFGESWDELKFYKYADLSLHAYQTWPTEGSVATFGNTYDNYGPAFVMAVALVSKPLQVIFIESDARHYLYFLTFLAGVWAFYELAKRWLSQNAAIFSTLLFATQPLLIGHAFISPKDIPFLSFFLLSLLFGLRHFDKPQPSLPIDLDPRSKRILTLLFALWLILTIGLFLFTDSFHTLIANLVQSAKAGEPNIISLIASDLTKVDASVYIQRYFTFFLWTRSFLFLLSSFFLLLTLYRRSPSTFRSLLSLLPSAILLGLTTSIRVLGPFAALFVIYYALRKHGKQAIFPLFLYGLVAIITMYLTWPYLWSAPIAHFIESVKVMSQYPWEGRVLFNGAEYASTQLPYSYLPVLLGIQLTEPVWVLILLGAVAAGLRRRPERVEGLREKRELLALTVVWFLIPLLGFVVARSPLYDNFRQIFFILPPMFMLAGVGFEKIKNVKWQVALMVLCLLPGIVDVVRLHPYEYVYYNRFAGDVFRKYELDYWGTSYREAAAYLNEVAPEHAVVWVEGPSHIFALYARSDIKVYSDYEAERADHYDYVVSTTRYNLDQTSYPDAKVIHTIERYDGILTVIKQP
jgi:4-amino-4-deoxy-L-arabinose transferase-like glycosyltransferase